MTKHILNLNNSLELDILFLQPTRYCARNCSGCYVKAHTGNQQSFHTPVQQIIILLSKYFYGQDKCSVNQITVAFDDPPMKEDSVSLEQRLHMDAIFHSYMHLGYVKAKTVDNQIFPELHATFHNINSIKKYAGMWSIHGIAQNLDLLSLSEIRMNELDDIKDLAKVATINYNHLIPSGLNAANLAQYLEEFIQIGQIVDQIYLVIFKTPIGQTQTKELAKFNADRMAYDRSIISYILKNVPDNIKSKITVDGCLRDVAKYRKSGYGCSANISKVQVWPDGTVSGCAYAFHTTGSPAKRVEDILENIKQARTQYDFKRSCHLKEAFSSH